MNRIVFLTFILFSINVHAYVFKASVRRDETSNSKIMTAEFGPYQDWEGRVHWLGYFHFTYDVSEELSLPTDSLVYDLADQGKVNVQLPPGCKITGFYGRTYDTLEWGYLGFWVAGKSCSTLFKNQVLKNQSLFRFSFINVPNHMSNTTIPAIDIVVSN